MPGLEDLSPEDKARAYSLFQFLRQNPDVDKQVRRAAKAKNPNLSAPDIELEDALAAQAKNFDDKLAADRKERLDAIQAERRKEAHGRITAAGLKPEDVEKVMVDENIGNYDTAIRYLKAQQQLAPATPASVQPMSMPESKGLWADRNKFAKDTAFEAINELKARRGQAA
jgi:hypothetical protein